MGTLDEPLSIRKAQPRDAGAIAQRTHAALGMAATGYLMSEEVKPGARFFGEPPA